MSYSYDLKIDFATYQRMRANRTSWAGKSHVLNAHEIFLELKIMVIKEEGDTSHVYQAYAQQVAKYDKTHLRAALNMINPVLGKKYGSMVLD